MKSFSLVSSPPYGSVTDLDAWPTLSDGQLRAMCIRAQRYHRNQLVDQIILVLMVRRAYGSCGWTE